MRYDWIENKADDSEKMEENYFFHKVREFMIRCIAKKDFEFRAFKWGMFDDICLKDIFPEFYEESKGPDQYYYTTREDAERLFNKYVKLILRIEKEELEKEAMQLRESSESGIESIVHKEEPER